MTTAVFFFCFSGVTGFLAAFFAIGERRYTKAIQALEKQDPAAPALDIGQVRKLEGKEGDCRGLKWAFIVITTVTMLMAFVNLCRDYFAS